MHLDTSVSVLIPFLAGLLFGPTVAKELAAAGVS